MSDETATEQLPEQTETPAEAITEENEQVEETEQVKSETEPVKSETETEVVQQEPEMKTEEEEEEEEEEEVEYCCPAEFDERVEMRKMFVGGLDKETSDDDFKQLFVSYGDIEEATIIRRNESKSDRLFGFVTFAKCDTLEEVLLKRPHKYKDRDLDIKRAVPKGQEDLTGHYKVKKLHVANITVDYKEKDLKRYLLSRHPKIYGSIMEINFLKSKEDEDKNRGFGFITVSTEDFADRISIGENKFTIDGNTMRISKAKPKNQEGGHRGGRGGGRMQNQYARQGWDDWSSWGPAWNYYGYDQYNYGPPHSYGYYREPHRGGRYHPYS